jgi:phosphoheptose isomerase
MKVWSRGILMPNNRKKSEPLSLAEKLLNVYEQGNPTLDFGETRSQLKALEWVQRIVEQLKENERRMKSNDR